jgi:hypothetical protein
MRQQLLLAGAAIATGGLLAPGQSSGPFIMGDDLLASCSSSELLVLVGDCLGFVTAIADTLNSGSDVTGWRACIPPGVTRGQLRDVDVDYLRKNPQILQTASASLAAAALQSAFPCKNP